MADIRQHPPYPLQRSEVEIPQPKTAQERFSCKDGGGYGYRQCKPHRRAEPESDAVDSNSPGSFNPMAKIPYISAQKKTENIEFLFSVFRVLIILCISSFFREFFVSLNVPCLLCFPWLKSHYAITKHSIAANTQ